MKMVKALLFMLLLFGLFTLSAAAKTIDVGSTYTYHDVASGVAASVSGDTVHVHAGTYTMGSGSVYLKSNTIVYGDGIGKTILYYSSTTGGKYEGSFQGGLECDSISNAEISGFTFHSDCPNEDSTGRGDGRACIDLLSSTHIKIHDCSIVKYV